jgi:3-hydroxyacyl-CoA dehydrogenase
MQLLEVVRADATSDATYAALLAYGKRIGKTTIQCKVASAQIRSNTVRAQDTPGFIVNRLLIPYVAEALRMAERGDATPRDIDLAMKLGAGYVIGPFELADFTGLDLNKMILDGK